MSNPDELGDVLRAAIRAEVRAEVAAQLEAARAAPDRLLSVDEATAALGIGRQTFYIERRAGRIRSVKVGRRRLVPAAAIADYIASRTDA